MHGTILLNSQPKSLIITAMKLIPTKIHGVLDYLLGFTFVLMPWILDLNEYGIQSGIFVSLGMFTLIMSIFTRYELGVWKKIPMSMHLSLDAAGAVLLMISPWLFGFANQVYLPHILMGGIELIAVIMSDSKSALIDHVMDPSDVYHQVRNKNNPIEEGFRPKRRTKPAH